MSLEPQIMDDARPMVADEDVVGVAVSAEALEARKAAKREAAKRFSEKQAADICRLTTIIGRQATAWGNSKKG